MSENQQIITGFHFIYISSFFICLKLLVPAFSVYLVKTTQFLKIYLMFCGCCF